MVGLTTVNPAAGLVPNLTPVTHWKPVPVMVTVVPPVVGPLLGTIPVTVGGALMSGPVAPHTLSDRSTTPPPATAESRVMTSASTVMWVAPTELVTTCLLISTLSSDDTEEGRAGTWLMASLTG